MRHVSAHRSGNQACLSIAGQGREPMSTHDELMRELPQHDVDKLYGFQLDRRDFLKLCGGGLLVCLTGVSGSSQESGRGVGNHELPKDVAAWLHIAADGKVTVFTGKVEVGQNIRTSLAQLVAEELGVHFDAITMVMGDTDLTPWDMGTFGSRSIPTMGPQLRTMAAAARQTLIGLAAQRWNVEQATLRVADGKVMEAQRGRSLTYGELTRGEKLVKTVSGDERLTPASNWKIAGTAILKAGGRDFVTGKHQYPSDITRPDMMIGKVLRPDGFKAKLVSLDASEAEKLPGVKVVHDGDFVGVVAGDVSTAQRALSALHAKWTVPAQISNERLFDYLKNNPESDRSDNRPQFTSGSIAQSICRHVVWLYGRGVRNLFQLCAHLLTNAPLNYLRDQIRISQPSLTRNQCA